MAGHADSAGIKKVIDQEVVRVREIIAANPLPNDLDALRKFADADALRFPVNPSIAVEKTNANGVPAEWTTPPGANLSRVVLYLHGGGYVFGSILSHRHLVAEIGFIARCRTLALDYRLAPEHPFPAPVEDALAGYQFLLESGVAANHITIAGDSAGGGLVVATMIVIRNVGLKQPACGWVISPWVDMEASGSSFDTLANVDPMVKREVITDLAATYLNGADMRSPLASPIHGDLRGLAPLLLQVGAAEVLLSDAIKLAEQAGIANVSVRFGDLAGNDPRLARISSAS
jgi:epsilon-lactone hydrolase